MLTGERYILLLYFFIYFYCAAADRRQLRLKKYSKKLSADAIEDILPESPGKKVVYIPGLEVKKSFLDKTSGSWAAGGTNWM